MNLKQFMMHAQVCPICSSNSLDLRSKASGKQSYRYEGNNIVFTRDMRGLSKKEKNYTVEYIINKVTLKFTVEFFIDNKRFEGSVPISVVKRFRALDKNLMPYIMSRKCTNCNRYQYWSNHTGLNFKSRTMNDIMINFEYFGIYKQIGSKYRIFKIDNNYADNKCLIQCIDADNLDVAEFAYFPRNRPLCLKITPLTFTTEHEVANRLDKLLVFA